MESTHYLSCNILIKQWLHAIFIPIILKLHISITLFKVFKAFEAKINKCNSSILNRLNNIYNIFYNYYKYNCFPYNCITKQKENVDIIKLFNLVQTLEIYIKIEWNRFAIWVNSSGKSCLHQHICTTHSGEDFKKIPSCTGETAVEVHAIALIYRRSHSAEICGRIDFCTYIRDDESSYLIDYRPKRGICVGYAPFSWYGASFGKM